MDIGLLGDVAVSILPVIHFKTPGGCLVAHVGIPVLIGLRTPLGRALVDIGQAVLTGIVGEGAALAVVCGEGDAVVIDAKVLLLARLCRPPFATGCSGRTAGHVGHLAVVDAPLLLGNAAEVVGIVNLGLVEGVLLLDTGLADTVAVTQSQFDGVGASLAVLVTHLLQGGVGGAVKDPDGIGARLRSVVGNHLVGLLVNADVKVNTAHRGDAVDVCAVKFIGRAGSEADRQ